MTIHHSGWMHIARQIFNDDEWAIRVYRQLEPLRGSGEMAEPRCRSATAPSSGISRDPKVSIVRDSTVEFLPQIPVQKIDFGDSDSESASRGTSAIISGFLVRSELGAEKVALPRAEQFRLTGASWTAAQGDHIAAVLGRNTAAGGLHIRKVMLSKQIYGQVTSVAYGPAGVERDGMPSKLEWIAANHRVKLIWAAIVFASGLLLGFGRWFSKSS